MELLSVYYIVLNARVHSIFYLNDIEVCYFL